MQWSISTSWSWGSYGRCGNNRSHKVSNVTKALTKHQTEPKDLSKPCHPPLSPCRHTKFNLSTGCSGTSSDKRHTIDLCKPPTTQATVSYLFPETNLQKICTRWYVRNDEIYYHLIGKWTYSLRLLKCWECIVYIQLKS